MGLKTGHQLVLKPSVSHLLCLNPTAWKSSPNFISLKVLDVEPRLRFPGQKRHAVSKDLLNTSTMKCRNVSRESKSAPRGVVILMRRRRERCKHHSVFRLLLLKSAGADAFSIQEGTMLLHLASSILASVSCKLKEKTEWKRFRCWQRVLCLQTYS